MSNRLFVGVKTSELVRRPEFIGKIYRIASPADRLG